MSSGALAMHIEASGLPGHPSGRITAHGDLLDAPLELAVALRQAGDGLAIDIERATWKSLEAGGALQLPTATMVADRQPACGHDPARRPGAADRPADRRQRAGHACGVRRLRPLDARIDAEGVQFGGFGGTLHATARGSVDAMDVNLTAVSPDLQGAPARLSAAAKVDATGQTVNLASLQADWREQSLRLLAPVRIGFSDGVTIDKLRLGLRQAVLEVSGRAGATLDLTASLRNLPADLVGADGTVKADARITGTSARPTGQVRLAATDLRLRSGPGRAMPPASITADADLNGTDARIDARIAAGGSRVNITGRAPLGAAGALNLRAGGTLDLALLDPIVAAGGRRVRGQVTLDTTITGTVAAPSVAGSARLAGGEVQDYASGLHLSDIAARVEGSGTTLRIAQFSAKAGQGTIAGSGSIGIMAPGTAGGPDDHRARRAAAVQRSDHRDGRCRTDAARRGAGATRRERLGARAACRTSRPGTDAGGDRRAAGEPPGGEAGAAGQ